MLKRYCVLYKAHFSIIGRTPTVWITTFDAQLCLKIREIQLDWSHCLHIRNIIWKARCLPVLRQMLWLFWGCMFSFVVLDVWAMCRVCDVVGIGAHHCSTSKTYNFMGTSSDLLNFGIYNDIMLNYRILQAASVKTLAICQKVRKRAQHPTTASRLILTVRWTPYARFLRKTSTFSLHRLAT